MKMTMREDIKFETIPMFRLKLEEDHVEYLDNADLRHYHLAEEQPYEDDGYVAIISKLTKERLFIYSIDVDITEE
jgi:hypothetical protein